jgi:hypothetical protein
MPLDEPHIWDLLDFLDTHKWTKIAKTAHIGHIWGSSNPQGTTLNQFVTSASPVGVTN